MKFGTHNPNPLEATILFLENAIKLKCGAAQIMTCDRNSLHVPISYKDEFVYVGTSFVKKIKELRELSNIHIISHAPLMTNFHVTIDRWSDTYEWLINEVERCKILGINKIVIHPGKNEVEPFVGHETVYDNIKRFVINHKLALEYLKITLCIENMSDKNCLVRTPGDFNWLAKRIYEDCLSEAIALCFDTAHAYGAGFGPFEFIDELSVKALSLIKVIHLNDSQCGGMGMDVHLPLGTGDIITYGTIIRLMNIFDSDDVDCIVEFPNWTHDVTMWDEMKFINRAIELGKPNKNAT